MADDPKIAESSTKYHNNSIPFQPHQICPPATCIIDKNDVFSTKNTPIISNTPIIYINLCKYYTEGGEINKRERVREIKRGGGGKVRSESDLAKSMREPDPLLWTTGSVEVLGKKEKARKRVDTKSTKRSNSLIVVRSEEIRAWRKRKKKWGVLWIRVTHAPGTPPCRNNLSPSTLLCCRYAKTLFARHQNWDACTRNVQGGFNDDKERSAFLGG